MKFRFAFPTNPNRLLKYQVCIPIKINSFLSLSTFDSKCMNGKIRTLDNCSNF